MPHAPGDRHALNPALLKLRILMEGVQPADGARGRFAEIEFEEGTIARARVTPASALRFNSDNGRGEIRIEDESALPARLNAERAPGDIVKVRGLYATVTLGGGCGICDTGRTCALCMGRELTERAGEWWPPGEVAAALAAALKSSRVRFVHFNVGYLPGDRAGLERLRDYIAAVRHYLDVTLCLTMHPPADLSAIDYTYAAGVDVVCYSLEAPDRESMERIFPGRARFLGRERYLAALAHGAKVFPRGATWSVILGDVAPVEATREAVRELTSIGVVPLLGFSGAAGTIHAQDLAPVGALMFDGVSKNTPSMHWTSGMATALTPFDARHLVSGAPSLPTLIDQLNRNRLGAFASRALARVRRRLRVRRVEVLDPSHL